MEGSERKVAGKKGRRAGWEELNEIAFKSLEEVAGPKAVLPKGKAKSRRKGEKIVNGGEETDGGDDGWEDMDGEVVMDDIDPSTETVATNGNAGEAPAVQQPAGQEEEL